MIYAEILKLIKNREIVAIGALWLVVSAILLYLLRFSFVNPKVYAVFDNQASYVIYQHAFLKKILFLANIFLVIVLLIQQKLNSAKILERKKTLPIKSSEFQSNELLAVQIVGFGLIVIATTLSLVMIYLQFAFNETLLEVAPIGLAFLGFSLLTSACVISIFFTLIRMFSNQMMATVFCLLLCLISAVAKVFPVQWGAAMVPQSMANLGHTFFYILLCLLLILLPFAKAILQSNNFFKIVFAGLFFLLGCAQNPKNNIENQFTPKINIVYIAFSLECNVCDDEVMALSKSTRLNFEKIAFVSVDGEKEIEAYTKSKKVNPRIKFNIVSEKEFKDIFGTMSFPQAIVLKQRQKVKLNQEVLKKENLESYVDKL